MTLEVGALQMQTNSHAWVCDRNTPQRCTFLPMQGQMLQHQEKRMSSTYNRYPQRRLLGSSHTMTGKSKDGHFSSNNVIRQPRADGPPRKPPRSVSHRKNHKRFDSPPLLPHRCHGDAFAADYSNSNVVSPCQDYDRGYRTENFPSSSPRPATRQPSYHSHASSCGDHEKHLYPPYVECYESPRRYGNRSRSDSSTSSFCRESVSATGSDAAQSELSASTYPDTRSRLRSLLTPSLQSDLDHPDLLEEFDDDDAVMALRSATMNCGSLQTALSRQAMALEMYSSHHRQRQEQDRERREQLRRQHDEESQRRAHSFLSSTSSSASTTNRSGGGQIFIEVAPGVESRLRGSDETWKALVKDFYIPTSCMTCSSGGNGDSTIFVIQDAGFVLCPVCRVVQPLPDILEPVTAGVGLGVTYDQLVSCQAQIERERGHHF